ncbi:unnamed protein product [Ascophyllum nodosum]
MYRVRVLAREGEPLANTRDVETLVRARLRTARDTRRVVGIPNADTNTYRLVNGEGDRLSGLVVDVFADVIGVSSSAVWVEAFRSEVEAALRQEFGAEATTIVWRRSDGRLQQDGWKGTGATTDAAGRGDSPVGLEVAAACPTAGFEGDGGRAGGAWDENVGGGGKKRGFRDDVPATVVRELGLEYEVRPQFGQKTGFYCDQRESREAVRKLSQGKTVLDMFCYSGGFALNAAVGGASRVLAVDSSQPALEEARINAGRNGLDRMVEFVKDDALAFMKARRAHSHASAAATTGDRFGVVVLDPPKLAPSKKSMANATSRYRRLNAAAIKLVQPGGILVTFTCSAAMTQSGTFVGTVQSAAAAAGRTLTLLRTVGPAADHVTNPCYPEGVYLTGAFFYVS